MTASPFVLVTVGTDHHPFDRLVRWVDAWLARGETDGVRCRVQGGTSMRPKRAEWVDYLPAQELEAAIRKATVVVAHAGPGTVAECRRLGVIPVVVPRHRELGEHVDDHQVEFARRLAREGRAVVADSEGHLAEVLDAAVRDPDALRVAPEEDADPGAIEEFGRLVEALVRRRRSDRRRRGHPRS